MLFLVTNHRRAAPWNRQSMRGANRRALANLKRPDSNQGVAGVRLSRERSERRRIPILATNGNIKEERTDKDLRFEILDFMFSTK